MSPLQLIIKHWKPFIDCSCHKQILCPPTLNVDNYLISHNLDSSQNFQKQKKNCVHPYENLWVKIWNTTGHKSLLGNLTFEKLTLNGSAVIYFKNLFSEKYSGIIINWHFSKLTKIGLRICLYLPLIGYVQIWPKNIRKGVSKMSNDKFSHATVKSG